MQSWRKCGDLSHQAKSAVASLNSAFQGGWLAKNRSSPVSTYSAAPAATQCLCMSHVRAAPAFQWPEASSSKRKSSQSGAKASLPSGSEQSTFQAAPVHTGAALISMASSSRSVLTSGALPSGGLRPGVPLQEKVLAVVSIQSPIASSCITSCAHSAAPMCTGWTLISAASSSRRLLTSGASTRKSFAEMAEWLRSVSHVEWLQGVSAPP